MIDIEEIERTIDKLEHSRDTSYAACERLAWLYVVRDHLLPPAEGEVTRGLGGSEFLDCCDGVPYPALMQVLDEHMSALRAVQPRAYDAVIRRVRSLR